MKTKSVLLLFTSAVLLMLAMCTKPRVELSPDEVLFEKSLMNDEFTWYKGSDAKLASTQVNAHNWQVRTRFNALAQSVLGADGKLPMGASFPEGSLIVKESYDDNGNFTVYAVMKKDADNPAANQGWLWAEYDVDGKAVHSINSNSTGCVNCHNASGNRDLVMFFERFP